LITENKKVSHGTGGVATTLLVDLRFGSRSRTHHAGTGTEPNTEPSGVPKGGVLRVRTPPHGPSF